MSSHQRRKELELELEVENRKRDAEYARRAALTIWERIEEADASEDVKEILHIIAEKLNIERL